MLAWDRRRRNGFVKLLSFIMAVVAAIVFIVGIIVRLSGGHLLMNTAPVTLWRFAVACIGFAIYVRLYATDRD